MPAIDCNQQNRLNDCCYPNVHGSSQKAYAHSLKDMRMSVGDRPPVHAARRVKRRHCRTYPSLKRPRFLSSLCQVCQPVREFMGNITQVKSGTNEEKRNHSLSNSLRKQKGVRARAMYASVKTRMCLQRDIRHHRQLAMPPRAGVTWTGAQERLHVDMSQVTAGASLLMVGAMAATSWREVT